jgi:hypothetical protein
LSDQDQNVFAIIVGAGVGCRIVGETHSESKICSPAAFGVGLLSSGRNCSLPAVRRSNAFDVSGVVNTAVFGLE